ncbi:MAG: hypothetical protein PF795_10440 [Kiritimatiellae bacterium]|nr:hypothetical protein [Kiritimatiellia bacterium]
MKTFFILLFSLGVLTVHPVVTGQIFEENFSGSSIQDITNGYLGGWYTSEQLEFGQWYGNTDLMSISDETLRTQNNSLSFRGAVFLIDPSLFW